MDAESIYESTLNQVSAEFDKLFTAEEGNGRFVDLNFNFEAL